MKFTELVFSESDLDRAEIWLYLAGCDGISERVELNLSIAAAFFVDGRRAGEASRMLRQNGIDHRVVEASADDDPMAGFRASAMPFIVGKFQIDPRDESADPVARVPGLAALRVPASCAFGTGLHESTAGILRFLGTAMLEGKRVLDVGCGSGILALAASALGAEFCVGLDLDPDAVFEARRNLERNPAVGRVALFAGPIDAVRGSFDLVLANMIFEEVAPIVLAIASLVAPEGRAVFSGILDSRAEDARAAIEDSGLSANPGHSDGTWTVLEAQK